MVARMEHRMEERAPGFRQLILARHVFSPATLPAADSNLDGGAINGGTAQLHQQADIPADPWHRAAGDIRRRLVPRFVVGSSRWRSTRRVRLERGSSRPRGRPPPEHPETSPPTPIDSLTESSLSKDTGPLTGTELALIWFTPTSSCVDSSGRPPQRNADDHPISNNHTLDPGYLTPEHFRTPLQWRCRSPSAALHYSCGQFIIEVPTILLCVARHEDGTTLR